MGVFKDIPDATASAKQDIKRALTVLDNHLLHNTYMAGHCITLADISLCCALLDGMRLVLDAEFRKPFGNLMRWFNTCIAQPQFASVIGNVTFCDNSSGAPVPKQAKQEGGQKKPKDAPKDTPKDASKDAPKKDNKKKQASDKAAPEAEKPAQAKVEDPEKARKDKLKKVIKEGGKRGV